MSFSVILLPMFTITEERETFRPSPSAEVYADGGIWDTANNRFLSPRSFAVDPQYSTGAA